jgi:hypothetical protein
MTVLDLIKSSLRLIKVLAASETPGSSESADALTALKLLLGEWYNDGLLRFTSEQQFAVSAGTASYQIAAGAVWDFSPSPSNVLIATLRDSGIDYPLTELSDSEYAEISEKTVRGIPSHYHYHRSASSGTCRLYPVPDKNYTITLTLADAFNEYALIDTISLPPGYLQALKYALAIELAPEYETEPSGWIVKRATDTMAGIKRSNLRRPGALRFDGVLTGSRGGGYDILTDS